jgi:plastocyanin
MKTKKVTILAAGCLAFVFLPACNDSNAKQTQAALNPAAPPAFSGTVHEIKMNGTATTFFFEPKELVIKQGDKVRWVMTAAGPHNVDFASVAFPDKTKVPNGAKVKLEAQGALVTPLLQAPGQTTEIIFGKDMPLGEYNYVCDPHTPLGMAGKIIVTP